MLAITKNIDGDTMTMALEGRLDTTTAPQLEDQMKDLDTVDKLLFDFTNLEYVSSAGLRMLLSGHKAMMGKGGMKITNVNEAVMEVFELTGFADILDIE